MCTLKFSATQEDGLRGTDIPVCEVFMRDRDNARRQECLRHRCPLPFKSATMLPMPKLVDVTGGATPLAFLNEQQRAAVLHGDGPLLVVAGAGTGKTRVITERIRYLLETQPDLAGEQILGLTFTERAAGEMKWRVSQTVGERGQKVRLSTFHAFCATILSELDPGARVLDQTDHWILLRRNLHLLQLERFARLAEPGQFLGDFVSFFSRCQDELVMPDDYQRYADELSARARRAMASGSGMEPDATFLTQEEAARQQEIARAYRASELLLREGRMLTFGSMLLGAVRQIDANPEFADMLRDRFRYILVDEFQDTNIAQLELLWRLAGTHRNIVAVGDDDQAIYRFRGASFGSFQIFLEKFAGVRGTSAKTAPVQALTKNYRSTERVLRVANQVISLNEKSELFPKKTLTASKPAGEKVRIVELTTAAHEARWVAEEIARLHTASADWRTFAVLYRSHTHRNLLVQELSQAPHSICNPQSFHPGKYFGEGPHRIPALDRFAGRRCRLRTRARDAGLAFRAFRSRAAGRARREEPRQFAVGLARRGRQRSNAFCFVFAGRARQRARGLYRAHAKTRAKTFRLGTFRGTGG